MPAGWDRTSRHLFLMRHAQAQPFSPGGDVARQLSVTGEAQAANVGSRLSSAGIEQVLCSPSARTRQTCEALRLAVPVRIVDSLYNCPPGRILTALARLPEYVRTALVVGHYPGVPGLVQQLADRHFGTDELARLARQFPPATVVELEFTGEWSQLHSARLVRVLKP